MNKELAYLHIALYQQKLAAVGLTNPNDVNQLPEVLKAACTDLNEISKAIGLGELESNTITQDIFDNMLSNSLSELELPEAYLLLSSMLVTAIQDDAKEDVLKPIIDIHGSSIAYLASQILKKNLEEIIAWQEQVTPSN